MLNDASRTLFFAAIASSFMTLTAAVPEAQAQAGLEEVVVTAQRREQNLADVPFSISTLSGDRLTDVFKGGEDIRALASRIPSLYAESSNGRVAPRFYIRGLGNTDFDLAASQPVSVVVDEIVQENVILKSFPLFDIERVEVLKGPQGSLFGRNTPAGIVKLDTVKPSHEGGGYVSAGFAELHTVQMETAFGGSLIEDLLAVRVSLLYQDRNDWIDNDFTGQSNEIGGFDELAWRLQFLLTPSEDLSILANVHGRDIEGTAAIFRANILDPGSDNLNSNFDRDSVLFDGGDNNPQEYHSVGGSLRIDYDLNENFTITSISGIETTDGSSRGDIDGGAFLATGGSAPGFIPFPSDTLDGIDDLDQITQEIRISYNDDRMNWQAGFYYFDSELVITTNPFFVPATTLEHTNTSIAFFGQLSYDITSAFNLTAGFRWTDDEKELQAVASNFPVPDVEVEDDEISWDFAALYQINEDINVYGRVAAGFRAPTIQGRDVAFFGAPSTANAETITSFELGFKSDWLERTLRVNAAAFYYRIEDQQLTAIGGAGNLVQLINADEGVGKGVELDMRWLPVERLSLGLSYSYNDTELEDDNLRVAPCGSGACTVEDPLDANGNAIVDGNSFPNAPEHIVYATANYSVPFRSGELYIGADYSFQGATEIFIYDSEEYQSEGNFELGMQIGYRSNNGWDVEIFGRNLTDEENLRGGIDFNNLTGYVNEPRIVGVRVRGNFGR